jgi:hypothetical protein
VSFPIKHGDFPGYVNLPEGMIKIEIKSRLAASQNSQGVSGVSGRKERATYLKYQFNVVS